MTDRVAKYRTIVADPPWDYSGDASLRFAWRRGRPSGDGKPMLAYQTMTLEQIAALRPPADDDAHLYLWTTQRFLWDARTVAQEWGFTPVKVLVWCKPPTGFALGGTFGSACEFVLFARKGSLKATAKVPRDWWEWSRSGGHSAKPEAFIDLVEQVSPGPYLEMFARRNRLGWDTWGNEALGHVEVSA
jgi:N6-adenosine-specific RNA methylase IME4